MCLGLKRLQLSDAQIIDSVNSGFRAGRNFFRRLLRCIDMLPNAYRTAWKWNVADYDK